MQHDITPEADMAPDPAAAVAACPVTHRPRNLEQYRAASAAADGDAVEEIDACAVRADATIWFPEPAPGRWKPVKDCHVNGLKTVIEFLVASPYSSSWTLASDRPVCQRLRPARNPRAIERGETGC